MTVRVYRCLFLYLSVFVSLYVYTFVIVLLLHALCVYVCIYVNKRMVSICMSTESFLDVMAKTLCCCCIYFFSTKAAFPLSADPGDGGRGRKFLTD